MSLALQNSEKTRALRLPATKESSERYPKAKQVDNRYGSVLNRFVASNGKGKAYTSLVRNSNLRTGGRKGSTAAENRDRKHVRFQKDVRQS